MPERIDIGYPGVQQARMPVRAVIDDVKGAVSLHLRGDERAIMHHRGHVKAARPQTLDQLDVIGFHQAGVAQRRPRQMKDKPRHASVMISA